MAKRVDRNPKLTYPPECKELNEELSKDELVKRLKMLAKAFQDLGQDDNNEYKELALYLASEFFMDHSSKDVRLLVACCIADIFRVFAPEAPYTETEHLKEIFIFLTEQLRGLSDPDSPSFRRYFYLLENLAWVKSFNICLELEDNQDILNGLFKMMFEIVSDKHSTKVIGFMLDVMCPLLTEADIVSQDLLDIILACILEPFKTQRRAAYSLARDLIRRSSSAIEPYVQTFFNNALMLGKTSESDLSDRLLDLIQELNGISPSILIGVLPQLEFKLKSADESERMSATRLLAKMFSEPNSDLAMLHKSLWSCFVGRFYDIDINVRRLCTQASQEFIVNHPELVQDVSGSIGIGEHLRHRQHDSDENVRMDVVQAIVGASKRALANVTDDLLECVKERTLDKKFKIRKEALIGLGQIYKCCCEANGNDLERLTWVRNKVLHAYYHNAVDDKVLVERILNTSLVPYSLEPAERMKRLYLLYTNLDKHAIKALQEIFRTQFGLRNLVRTVLDIHQKGDSEEVIQMLSAKVVQLSRFLSEPPKAQEHLKKFVGMIRDDMKMRGNLLKLVTPGCSCKKAEDYVKEIIRKLGNPVPNNFLYTNVKQLLERIAPVMIDGSAVMALATHIKDIMENKDGSEMDSHSASGSDDSLESGMNLLLMLSNVYQSCFHSEDVYRCLLVFVRSEDDSISDIALQILKNVGVSMEQMFPAIHSILLPILQKMSKSGTPKQAKHALRCIDAMCKSKDEIFRQLYEHLKQNMKHDSPNFLTSLVGIGHLSLMRPSLFVSSTEDLVNTFIKPELLSKDRTIGRKSNESWCQEHLVSEETLAKIQGLKLMVRWLLGCRTAGNKASSTFRLLYTMILCEGDLMEQGNINKAEMARLRLQAGCCMLKLAQEPIFADAIRLEQFETMALLVNDPCYEVRVQFVQKLHKGLLVLRLPLQYMGVLCLGALDPLKERRGIVKQMFVANVTRRREYLKQNFTANSNKIFTLLPDYVLPYAIHLLAHDPDYTTYDDVNALKGIKDCLTFMLDPLLTKNENISFNFYKKMFESIKQRKDVQCLMSDEANKKLYAICDLALTLISAKSSHFSLTEFAAEPILPKRLYTEPDLARPNTTVYLPSEFLTGQASKAKKPAAVSSSSAKASENKKKNTSTVLHDSTKLRSRIESPDSSSSSNPSSPVSSTKSSPHGLSERNRTSLTNKLHSARAISKAQGGGKTFSPNDDIERYKRGNSNSRGESSEEDVESSSLSHRTGKKSAKSPSGPKKSAAMVNQLAVSAKKKKPSSIASSGSATRTGKSTQGKISDFMKKASTRGKGRSESLDRTSSADSSVKPASTDFEDEEEMEADEEVEENEEVVEESEVESEEEEEKEKKAAASSRRRASVSNSQSSLRTSTQGKKTSATVSKKQANVRMTSKKPTISDGNKTSKKKGSSTEAASLKRQRDSSQESSSLPSGSVKRPKSRNLSNGTSDGEEDESSGSGKRGKTTALPSAVLRRRKGVLAIKRREGAAARAAQKYADFEVPVGIITPKKKR